VKIVVHWRPEFPGLNSSTMDERDLLLYFGDAEADRILRAIGEANHEPVTLTVSGHDAGYLDLDFVNAEFRIIDTTQRGRGRA
jgi:hypothetical protein